MGTEIMSLLLWPSPGKEDEFPKKPLGQLPPEPAVTTTNHMVNGQSHNAKPVEVQPAPVADPERPQESRPSSRARRSSLEKLVRQPKAEKREARSRGSGELDPRKLAPVATSSPLPTAPNAAAQDEAKATNHATANHNSNAVSSTRKEITPRWVKPSETKLEAARSAAAESSKVRGLAYSRGGTPPPAGLEDSQLPNRRPRSRGGFVADANRGSNASQYDNVPGLEHDFVEVPELEQPPSRGHFGTLGPKQSSPNRVPNSAGGVTGHRVQKHVLQAGSPDSRPVGKPPPSYSNTSYLVPPLQLSPGRSNVAPPFHTTYSIPVDHRPEERNYSTTVRAPSSHSPEKALMNNSYATYRRTSPSKGVSARITVAPAEQNAQFDSSASGSSSYLRQPTRLISTQVYPPKDYGQEGWRRVDQPPLYHAEGHGGGGVGGGRQWSHENDSPPSPSGVPRSPSFHMAQMSPLNEFRYPPAPDGLRHYRTQYPEQQPPPRQQQLPPVFGGPHYRHAPEAFAMQESMLL